MPERTANPHNHIEIIAVHEREVGHRYAAQFAHDICVGVAATRGLCEYDRSAPSPNFLLGNTSTRWICGRYGAFSGKNVAM